MAAKPVQKYRAGPITVALWDNEIVANGRTVRVLKATVERRYKDNTDGTWKSSGSFARNELPLAIWCLQKAFDHMINESSTRSDDTGDEDTSL